MKKSIIINTLLTIVFVIPGIIFAVTYNTISDGGNGYGATWDNTNEQFSRSDGKGLKLTWDADEVFIEVTGDTEHFIYFSGSSGTTSGKSWDITPTLPFNAQYLAVLEFVLIPIVFLLLQYSNPLTVQFS